MNIIDTIKDLLGGAGEHVQNLTDNEAVQNVKDSLADVTGQAEELTSGLGEQAQGVVDGLKDKISK